MAAWNIAPVVVAGLLCAALLSAPSPALAARPKAKGAKAGKAGKPSGPMATHDITKFGAVGDGKHDSTPAILKAWQAACSLPGRNKVLIPKGSYLTRAMMLQGPCKGPMLVRLNGNLLGTGDLNAYQKDWIQVNQVDNFVMEGGGVIDGMGANVWKKKGGKALPMSLVLSFVRNGTVRGITLKDSKSFHMNMWNSSNIVVRKVKIVAPADSPNTDGIHMGDAERVTIKSTDISAGDDCISIGPGSKHVKVRKVRCGPGHGISVGSLGRYVNEGDVEDVDVRNCTIRGTSYGLRIKSFAESKSKVKASKFNYQNVVMDNVSFPIIIDQEYCPGYSCSKNSNSKVSVHEVVFKNIVGTSATPEAVMLKCDKNLPCDVQLINVNLKYNGAHNKTMAVCKNAYGKAINVAKELSSCL